MPTIDARISNARNNCNQRHDFSLAAAEHTRRGEQMTPYTPVLLDVVLLGFK